MREDVHPNPDEMPKVCAALDRVLNDLKDALELHCQVSDDFDTPESVERHSKKFRTFMESLNGTPISPATPEELDRDLDQARNRTSIALGHYEKRIREILTLRDAVASGKPTQKDLKDAQEVLINAIMRAVIKDHWDSSQRPQKARDGLRLYADALVNGFSIAEWDCFPYDEPPFST